MIKIIYSEFACEHFRNEIKKAENDIANHNGSVIVQNTGSEHYILRILKGVRIGELRTDDIHIEACGRKIDVDVKGDLIQPWPDDLLEADFYLRFDV